MDAINRLIEPNMQRAIARGKSILLLGARQTGKTTLLKRFSLDLDITLIQPDVRQRYEKSPTLLQKEAETLSKSLQRKILIGLDEVQKVPALMDVAQDLHDRQIAQLILTGSSARKLKSPNINLLPGRVVAFHLDPLTLSELPDANIDITQLLLFGTLPGIVLQNSPQDKNLDLRSYVTTYLEEEIRMEAVVRQIGSFTRFLELASSESGSIVNFQKLSKEIGVAHSTIASYYQILEDCLVAERIEPISESKTRKKLTRSQRYIMFDLGIRRVAGREGLELPEKHLGGLFEQYVGLELIKLARLEEEPSRIRFWRDPDGPEVDFIIEKNHHYTPVEVKWSSAPTEGDARHIEVFLREYSNSDMGYIVCQTPRAFQVTKHVKAIPWQEIPLLFI